MKVTGLFATRPLTTYSLPLQVKKDKINAKTALLDFGKAGTIDIGALCYLERARRQSYGAKCRKVDLSSLSEQRELNVRTLIYQISELHQKGSLRITSLIVEVSYFINFVDWCDSRHLNDVLGSQKSAKEALKAYILDLRKRNRQGKLKLISAIHYQNSAIKMLMAFHESDFIHDSVRLMRNNQRSEPTSPPDEVNQVKLLSICNALFDGLCDLVIGNQPYPFKLVMPQNLNWPTSFLWIFPTTRWVLPPHEQVVRHTLKNGHWAYNYSDGTLARAEDIAHHYKSKKQQQHFLAQKNIDDARAQIIEANSDRNHGHRRDAAVLAHNTFVLLFVANTGMNWAQVRSLLWGSEHKIGPTLQGFRAVKYRANNKLVSFEIGSAFSKKFKKFIELRAYLLNGNTFDKLFFGYGPNLTKNSLPQDMAEGTLNQLFRRLTKLDPTVVPILTRQWRAAKSDHLIRKHDVSTAALLLQNTEATIERSYAAGSEFSALEEMSTFFARLSSVVVERKQGLSLVQSPVGACESVGSPLPIENNVDIIPDCRRLDSCLFCDKYRLHADETDIRKILSLKYFIDHTAHLTDSVEHFETLFNESLLRIDQLLNEIRARGQEKLIERVLDEVQIKGEIDSYWEEKLSLVLSLESI